MTFRAVKDGRTITRDSEDDGECIHGMGLDLGCTSCQTLELKRNKSSHLDSPIIESKYSGSVCLWCEKHISEGEQIVHHDQLGWIHANCP